MTDSKKPLKLHLGCGNIKIDGYINIDYRYTSSVDIVTDIRTLSSFKENSVDVIYACNVIEHFKKYEFPEVLKRWHNLLRKGGLLRLSVPDFEALCEYYMQTKDLDTMYCALYGGQTDEWNFHYWCWDFTTIKRDLENIGFTNIRRYDRNKTEHAHVRDWSLNYMPYLDGDGTILPDDKWFKGKFVALNIECNK